MDPANRGTNGTGAADALRDALGNQYHAALAMLKQAIEKCPDELWADRGYRNPFWRIAYHVLYYVHLYIQPDVGKFRPWEHHQTGLQDLDDLPAPPEIQDLVELPHRPPLTGKPLSRERILEYWRFCDDLVDDAVDALDVFSPQSGFSWYGISKMEHQLVALRHVQHHAAQLGERVRQAADLGVEWVGSGRKPRPFPRDDD